MNHYSHLSVDISRSSGSSAVESKPEVAATDSVEPEAIPVTSMLEESSS